jgi:hypothetical protein
MTGRATFRTKLDSGRFVCAGNAWGHDQRALPARARYDGGKMPSAFPRLAQIRPPLTWNHGSGSKGTGIAGGGGVLMTSEREDKASLVSGAQPRDALHRAGPRI